MRMKAKKRTAAQVAEDCLVYDKPITLQQQVANTGTWSDVQHIHANINKAGAGGGFSAENDRLRLRLLFRMRYFTLLETIRSSLQDYRILYNGQHYEITDYDDYCERRRVIKLTGELYELPVTVTLLTPTTSTVLGVLTKTYPATGTAASCIWESLQSDEQNVNGVISVKERAKLTFRSISTIQPDCRILRADGSTWEITGQTESTGLAGRWMEVTVQRISGGA